MNRIDYRQVDFRNNQVTGRQRLAPRPFYCSYRSPEQALQRQKNISGRYHLLNGDWQFCYQTTPYESNFELMENYQEEGQTVDFSQLPAEPILDSVKLTTMPVPGHWQLNGFGQPHYNDNISLFPIQDDICLGDQNPTGIYQLLFDSPMVNQRLADGEAMLLRFDGVESAYHVWLNGQFVGYSQGSRLTAEFDVTDKIRLGQNRLVVKVYMFSDGSYLENQDMWWFGGIMRDVCLISRPKLHISDYQLIPIIDQWSITGQHHQAKQAKLVTNITLTNQHASRQMGHLHLSLLDQGKVVAEQLVTYDLVENSQQELSVCLSADSVQLWSAEKPYLYDLLIQLDTMDGAENQPEVIAPRVGFRVVEVVEGVLKLNNRPLKIKGVNRHDWHSRQGRVIDEVTMRQDLLLMKEHHINAVRTAHYPNQPLFYDLCDELGLYVMSEADLETNQMQWTPDYDKLSDAPEWQFSYLDRVERLVRRDRNHSSILFWSLGNESGYGCNFAAAYQQVRNYDQSRLVHYEEDKAAASADVFSSMYTSVAELADIGRQTSLTKPHIVCEYAHAMGNGPGGLAEYWQVFEAYERLAGGYIWEWVDQALAVEDEQGRTYYRYGGDYGDVPNNGNFCADGLVQADRRPTPALVQVAKVFEPVRAEELTDGWLTLRNRYDFSCLHQLQIVWQIKEEGELIKQASIDRLPIFEQCGPGETCKVQLWKTLDVAEWLAERSGQCRVIIRLYRNGQSVGQAEWCLKERQDNWGEIKGVVNHQEQAERKGQVKAIVKGKWLEVTGPTYQAKIKLVDGQLADVIFDGCPIIRRSLGPTFWRAPIDNDINQLKHWQKHYLPFLKNTVQTIEWQIGVDDVQVNVHHTIAPIVLDYRFDMVTTYHFHEQGIELTLNGRPSGQQLPSTLPRIGYRLVLDRDFEEVTWYGRGPEENYADSKAACLIDRYQSTVTGMYFPYVVPQETGHRSDTDWLTFSDGKQRLKIVGQQAFGFSALHYTAEALTRATHGNELIPSEEIILTLDLAQHGLGSASWGPEALPAYCLQPKEFTFCLRLFGEKE